MPRSKELDRCELLVLVKSVVTHIASRLRRQTKVLECPLSRCPKPLAVTGLPLDVPSPRAVCAVAGWPLTTLRPSAVAVLQILPGPCLYLWTWPVTCPRGRGRGANRSEETDEVICVAGLATLGMSSQSAARHLPDTSRLRVKPPRPLGGEDRSTSYGPRPLACHFLPRRSSQGR